MILINFKHLCLRADALVAVNYFVESKEVQIFVRADRHPWKFHDVEPAEVAAFISKWAEVQEP